MIEAGSEREGKGSEWGCTCIISIHTNIDGTCCCCCSCRRTRKRENKHKGRRCDTFKNALHMPCPCWRNVFMSFYLHDFVILLECDARRQRLWLKPISRSRTCLSSEAMLTYCTRGDASIEQEPFRVLNGWATDDAYTVSRCKKNRNRTEQGDRNSGLDWMKHYSVNV